jgi:hypothetical protein
MTRTPDLSVVIKASSSNVYEAFHSMAKRVAVSTIWTGRRVLFCARQAFLTHLWDGRDSPADLILRLASLCGHDPDASYHVGDGPVNECDVRPPRPPR